MESAKIELAKYVLGIENPQLIRKLLDLIKSESAERYQGFSEAEKEELETGLRQLNSGQRISLEELLNKVS